MRKKLLCFLTAAMLLLPYGSAVFAATYTDSVPMTGNIQVTNSGNGFATGAGDSITVTKTNSQGFPIFDFLCTLNMDPVRKKFTSIYEDWEALLGYVDVSKWQDIADERLQNSQISGDFTLTINYPSVFTVPEEFLSDNQMVGFSDDTKRIFGNDVRTLTTEGDTSTIVITVELLGLEDANGTRPGYVLAKDLRENLTTYLADFTLECDGVQSSEYGTFEITGELTGSTHATSTSNQVDVSYNAGPSTMHATCIIRRTSASTGGGRGGGVLSTGGTHTGNITDGTGDTSHLTFEVGGDTNALPSQNWEPGSRVDLSELPVPHRDGYVFDGWYMDEALTQPASNPIVVQHDMVLHASFHLASPASMLNSDDHFAYIVGYPEGDVRPNNYITREEVATIFFRLLSDAQRDAVWSTTNAFSDVAPDRWSNNAISTMQNGGYLTGYPDGTFLPQNPITRAEFATIASRLDSENVSSYLTFSDMKGHWAEQYVSAAAQKGWITGYQDGTFLPNQNITRAEAMTIINRMLCRYVNENGLHSGATIWPDNSSDEWYYYAVEEATNSHNFTRPDGEIYETWSALTENRDWSLLER